MAGHRRYDGVDASTRAKRQFKSWHTLERPLHWLLSWVQSVMGYTAAMGEDETTIVGLAEDLEDCQQECRTIPSIIGLWRSGRALVHTMQATAATGPTRQLSKSCTTRSRRPWGARGLALRGTIVRRGGVG